MITHNTTSASAARGSGTPSRVVAACCDSTASERQVIAKPNDVRRSERRERASADGQRGSEAESFSSATRRRDVRELLAAVLRVVLRATTVGATTRQNATSCGVRR